MKVLLSVIIALILMMAVPTFAKKPPWAGHGGRNRYQGHPQDKTMPLPAVEENETATENIKKGKKDKNLHKKQQKHKKAGEGEIEQQEKDLHKGLEKQRTMKEDQVQKDLDKGSEQGQESRQKRKKWWKFGQ